MDVVFEVASGEGDGMDVMYTICVFVLSFGMEYLVGKI